MISHPHQCVFVHIPKVAGVSIEQVFLKDLGLDQDNRIALVLGKNPNRNQSPPRLSHLTALEMVDQHFISRRLLNSYFSFSFVRNPYHRVRSFYRYFGYDRFMDIDEFVLSYLPELFHSPACSYFFRPQVEYIFDRDGEQLVNFVGKLEQIKEDFAHAVTQIQFQNGQAPELTHSNRSEQQSKKTVLKRQMKIVLRSPRLSTRWIKKTSVSEFQSLEAYRQIESLYQSDFSHFNYSTVS